MIKEHQPEIPQTRRGEWTNFSSLGLAAYRLLDQFGGHISCFYLLCCLFNMNVEIGAFLHSKID